MQKRNIILAAALFILPFVFPLVAMQAFQQGSSVLLWLTRGFLLLNGLLAAYAAWILQKEKMPRNMLLLFGIGATVGLHLICYFKVQPLYLQLF